MTDALISLCIPTHQRADLLSSTTAHHIEQFGKYNIPIIISDNASTDHTETAVSGLKTTYPRIQYYKQDSNITDHNIPFVLRQVQTKYAWLMADKHTIKADGIGRILEIIERDDYDLIVTNDCMRVKGIATRVYTDPTALLEDLGWHMTDIAALIFSKKLIEEIPFERFAGTNFMHTAGIFEAIARRPCRVLWLNENLYEPFTHSTASSWRSQTLEVWMASWTAAIMSLPPSHYPFDSKVMCLRKHNSLTGLLSFESMVAYKLNGLYTLEKYKHFSKYVELCSDLSKASCLFIATAPAFFLKALMWIRGRYRMLRKPDE